jgi:hypothetical protein
VWLKVTVMRAVFPIDPKTQPEAHSIHQPH